MLPGGLSLDMSPASSIIKTGQSRYSPAILQIDEETGL